MGTAIGYDPIRDTIQVRAPGMPGKPYDSSRRIASTYRQVISGENRSLQLAGQIEGLALEFFPDAPGSMTFRYQLPSIRRMADGII
jgi:hypothetical protein